ncbi:glyoxalase [Streptomyces nanshensis]|nr:glyoxalase [Streptomyces nanshensis]
MTSTLQNIAVDCSDPYALARFWSEVLGVPVHPDDKPGDTEVGLPLEGGRELLFLKVPEPKAVKNRLHLCVAARESRDREVERLLERGASMSDDHRNDDGSGWAVLTDPEGNEFCVLRSAAERRGAQAGFTG